MKLTENGFSLGRALTSSATTSTSSLVLVSLELRERAVTLSGIEGLTFVDASSTLPTLSMRETLTLRLSLGYSVVKEYVAVRVSAVTGYFDTVFAGEIFTDKVEAEVICLKDETGETCINKAKLDSLLLLDPRQADIVVDKNDSALEGDGATVLGTSTESGITDTSSSTEVGSTTVNTEIPGEPAAEEGETSETQVEQEEVEVSSELDDGAEEAGQL